MKSIAVDRRWNPLHGGFAGPPLLEESLGRSASDGDAAGMTAHEQAQRSRLRTSANCRFVEADEFLSLAISVKSFLRADDETARLRGLIDPLTGEQILIEEEKLFHSAPSEPDGHRGPADTVSPAGPFV